jgi:hypothetical protein
MPNISVLLPVHNGARYLAESIDSVLAQEDVDFELLVLDDQSTDESADIVHARRDSRLRYSRNAERFGLFKTLNRGFAEARCNWVRLWADDDRMLPGSLRAFQSFAAGHGSAGLMYCDFYEIDQHGLRTGRESIFEEQRRRTPEVAGPLESALLFYCYGCLPGNISTVMLRKDVASSVGLFQTSLPQGAEYDLWVRISAVHPVGFVRDRLIELRNHPLQYGRLGQRQMTSIEDKLQLVSSLRERLTGLLEPDELDTVWRRLGGCQHIHWIARALARGDWAAARKGWAAARRYGHPLRQLLQWLLSVNGHLRPLNVHELVDRTLPRCGTLVEAASASAQTQHYQD